MAKTEDGVQLDDMKFPSVPERTLEEVDILELMIAGHVGLGALYDRLFKEAEGEAGFIVRLLRRDWQILTEALHGPVRELHRELANSDPSRKTGSGLSAAETKKLANRMKDITLSSLLAVLESVAHRCSICMQMVPVGSVSPRTRELFRQGLEAEDLHLSQLAWLRGVLDVGE